MKMMQKKIRSLIYAGLGLILCVLLCGGGGMTAQAQESGIPIKGIAAAGIGYEGEKFPVSQIIDPGKWCFRCSDHIFLMLIIKVTKFHNNLRFLTIKLNEGGAKNLRNTW